MMKWNGGGNAPTLNMEKFLIIQDTVCNSKRVQAGDVVEISDYEGRMLIAMKKAERFVEKPKAKQQDRSVGLEKSETKVLKKKSKS